MYLPDLLSSFFQAESSEIVCMEQYGLTFHTSPDPTSVTCPTKLVHADGLTNVVVYDFSSLSVGAESACLCPLYNQNKTR